MVLLHLCRRNVACTARAALPGVQRRCWRALTGSSRQRPDRQALDNLGSWNTTALSIDYEKSAEGGRLIPKVDPATVGVSCSVNKRKYNEDRHLARMLAVPAAIDESVLCAAVFDGHGGALAADFCAAMMAPCIESNLRRDDNIERVLRRSFVDVNAAFANFVEQQSKASERGVVSEQHSGTTAVVCLLVGGEQLYTAHVGDSRALLCRLASAYPLTRDHEPERLDERQRVEAVGAIIATNSLGRALVEGKLSMTRSLGDLHLKRYGVIAEPEVSQMRVKHHKDAFIMLVTDGVTFSISNQEMIDAVLSVSVEHTKARSCGRAQHAAEAVTQRAITLGSSDNCTAMVVPLGMWGRRQASSTIDMDMPFEFGRMLSGKFNDS